MNVTTKRISGTRVALLLDGEEVGEVFRNMSHGRFVLRLHGIYWSPTTGEPTRNGGWTSKVFDLQRDAIAAVIPAITSAKA